MKQARQTVPGKAGGAGADAGSRPLLRGIVRVYLDCYLTRSVGRSRFDD